MVESKRLKSRWIPGVERAISLYATGKRTMVVFEVFLEATATLPLKRLLGTKDRDIAETLYNDYVPSEEKHTNRVLKGGIET